MQGAQSLAFKPLSDVRANEIVSVYGLVLTCKLPRKTRGTDYSMTLFLSDGSITGDVSVNIFRPNLSEFPPLTPTDEGGVDKRRLEVVQLRRFKAQSYGGSVQLLSCQWSGWTVFFKDDDGIWKVRAPAGNFNADEKEVSIFEHILTATDNRKKEFDQGIVHSNVPTSGRPLLTVRDLAPNIYFDLNCQVVKVLNTRDEDSQQLFTALVTDYTENVNVHFESAEFDDIPSYLRNAIVHVTFWDNFVPTAKQVIKDGAFISLRNLHARTNNIDGTLVAVLHGDPKCSRPQHYVSAATGFENVLLQRKKGLEKLEDVRANHIPQMSLTRLIRETSKLPWSRINDILQMQDAGIFKTRAIVKQHRSTRGILKLTLHDNSGEMTVAVVGERLKEFVNDGGGLERLSRSLLPSEFCIFGYINAHGQRIAGVIAGHPFDTIKVRLQASVKQGEYKTILGTLRRIVKHEGTLGLFKGMAAPMVGVATINALLFGVYGWILDVLHPPQAPNNATPMQPNLCNVFWAGCGSGLANSIISGPSELAKIKLQRQDSKTNALYRGPTHFLREAVRSHGFTSIFRGMTATILRETPSYGVYFATFECLSRLIERRNESVGLTMVELMLAGGLAGVAGWISTYPIDVVKTRIQASPLDKYQSILAVFRHIYQTEGPRAFTRGLGATILRAFPTNAVIFLAYKESTNFIESLQEQKQQQ